MATENMTNRKPTKCEMFTEILNILNGDRGSALTIAGREVSTEDEVGGEKY